MTAKASPLEVTVGDPVTLNIQLSGEGTVDSLTLPKLAWPGFKSCEPSISSEQADPLGLSGTKVFEQVIIPENDSITEVPKIELAYFNPEEETYMTLSQGPFPLKVNPSAKPVRIPTTTANGDNSTGIETIPRPNRNYCGLSTSWDRLAKRHPDRATHVLATPVDSVFTLDWRTRLATQERGDCRQPTSSAATTGRPAHPERLGQTRAVGRRE